MKNFIEYYYGINIGELRLIDDKYHFIYNGCEYIFEKYNNIAGASEKYELSRYLSSINPRFHSIIQNRKKEILTFDGNDYYMLLRINIRNNRIIEIDDILSLKNVPVASSSNISWKSLWEQKIDNFEYYIDYIQDRAEETREFYDYFIGMGETAITYLSSSSEVNNNYFICHNRLEVSDTLYDLYNPLNIVIDHYTRDVAEYLKSCFFQRKNVDIAWTIDKFQIDSESAILLISRLLFPTFFFDLYEKDVPDKVLITKKLIDRMSEYEKFVSSIITVIKKRTNVPLIKWLNT